MLYAIAVHATECWILALQHDGDQKVTGCLEAANRELRRRDLRPLSNGRGEKVPIAYDEAMRALLRKRVIADLRGLNASLDLMLAQLEPPASGASGDAQSA